MSRDDRDGSEYADPSLWTLTVLAATELLNYDDRCRSVTYDRPDDVTEPSLAFVGYRDADTDGGRVLAFGLTADPDDPAGSAIVGWSVWIVPVDTADAGVDPSGSYTDAGGMLLDHGALPVRRAADSVAAHLSGLITVRG